MKNAAHHVWELMSDLDFCVLTTKGKGEFLARPMSSIVKPEEGIIYFLSNSQAAQVEDLSSGPDVLLAYHASNTYVCARGSAKVLRDRALIKRLWNNGAQAFWPAGPDQADVVVLAVQPDFAEYWEGNNSVVTVAKMATALITGTTPDMGENQKVRL